MLQRQSAAFQESVYPGLWSMRELRSLLLFPGRDVGLSNGNHPRPCPPLPPPNVRGTC